MHLQLNTSKKPILRRIVDHKLKVVTVTVLLLRALLGHKPTVAQHVGSTVEPAYSGHPRNQG